MNITIHCSSPDHPVNDMLFRWIKENEKVHDIQLVRHRQDLKGGDLLFLISCNEIIREFDRNKYKKSLVIHASDLPKGRGWSPHIWEIINGADHLTVTLLEAKDKVDSGDIWQKVRIDVPKHALFDEINELLFKVEANLMDFAVHHFKNIQPQPQDISLKSNYYAKRTPSDSQIDPEKSLKVQFDLIRVCDPQRFPAFFNLYGQSYKLTIEKINNE